MDENEQQEFTLEDILIEFGEDNTETDVVSEEEVLTEAPAAQEVLTEEDSESVPEEEPLTVEGPEAEEPAPQVSGDTIRMDSIREDLEKLTPSKVEIAQPIEEEEEEEPLQPQPQEEAFSDQWEPEYEQPMGEYIPPQPIAFHPRSRLRELKRKLVQGPERRYYQISELGLGKLQFAIFVSVLIVLISAAVSALYAFGMVPAERTRLMVFGQLFLMLLAALPGSYQLIEGVADLFKKKFTLNTLLVITFLACIADAAFCLQSQRIPCCAAFSLEMLMSLWSAYHKRNTELGMMDTMRKATQLDKVAVAEEYFEDAKGLLRDQGQVEDFMDTYQSPSGPEKVLNWYALSALIAAVVLGVLAGVLHGVSTGVQVLSVSLLAGLPATAFITLTRPWSVLERQLHKLGTVLCGWQGVVGLRGKPVFPVSHEDLFPAGAVKMNGVKFFSNRDPDEIVAYCTALVVADGGGLAPLFTQVLESRNGRHYDVENLRAYPGGLGGEVCDEPVLVGALSFLRDMGVDVPEGIHVSQAVCVAIDGELCGLFAVTYEKTKSAVAGLNVLCSDRKIKTLLTNGDFMLTDSFLRAKFGINPKRIHVPEYEVCKQLKQKKLAEDAPALVMTTRDGLAGAACGVVGARALHTASILGVVIHMVGGIIGLAAMAVLTVLGRTDLLTPVNMFLYQLVWLIPGLLVTQWTKVM